MEKIILASNSPRRKEILASYGVDFEIISRNIDEKKDFYLSSPSTAMSIAYLKGRAVADDYPNRTVLSCDTIVECNGKILGKPVDENDAKRMLNIMSDSIQHVITGFSILNVNAGYKITDYCDTLIKFKKISDYEISSYIKTGDYKDKAGGYGIQSGAYDFVEMYEGDIENVIGFPALKILSYLRNGEQCE